MVSRLKCTVVPNRRKDVVMIDFEDIGHTLASWMMLSHDDRDSILQRHYEKNQLDDCYYYIEVAQIVEVANGK